MKDYEIIGELDGITLYVIFENGVPYVTIKPICEVLGVNWSTQVEKLNNNPSYSKYKKILRSLPNKDNKRYMMISLPLEIITPWLFSINPLNMPEDKRKLLISNQHRCNKLLLSKYLIKQNGFNSIYE